MACATKNPISGGRLESEPRMTSLRHDRNHASLGVTHLQSFVSAVATFWQVHVVEVAMVSCRPTRTFKDGPLRGSFRQTYHA